MFLDNNLTLTTKKKVYRTCVLSVLLYGSECWTPRQQAKLLSSHVHSDHPWDQQQAAVERSNQHGTSEEEIGDEETAAEMVTRRRLE